MSRSGVRSIRTSSVCPMISPPHRVFGENAKGNIPAVSSSVRLQKEELLSSGEQEIFRRFQIFYIGRRTFLHKKEPHRTNGFLCDSVMREQSGSCCPKVITYSHRHNHKKRLYLLEDTSAIYRRPCWFSVRKSSDT